jgi:hypothetical protein
MLEARRTSPYTEHVLPILQKERIEADDPKVVMSRVERELANRVIPKTLSEDPKRTIE